MDWRDGLLMLIGQQAAGLVQSDQLLKDLAAKVEDLRMKVEVVDPAEVDTEEETE